MKTVANLFFILCTFMLHAQKESFSLTVKLSHVKSSKGEIRMALYNHTEKFTKVDKTYRYACLKPTGEELVYEFKDLEKGNYAICLFQDENGNKKLDTNYLGIPTESYAFSNNIRPRFSAPTFEECSTYLDKNKVFLIKMIY